MVERIVDLMIVLARIEGFCAGVIVCLLVQAALTLRKQRNTTGAAR